MATDTVKNRQNPFVFTRREYAAVFVFALSLVIGVALIGMRDRPNVEVLRADALESTEKIIGAIPINTAGIEELQLLPGIGENRACAIIADREANGLYLTVDSLMRIHGIGPGIVESIRPYVSVEPD
jgi:competence protein ComEA